MLHYLVVVFFTVWIALTILGNTKKFEKLLGKSIFIFFLPQYRFFAPIPARGDYHLLYKDYYEDGYATDWTEISLIQERKPWNIIWNPGKRERKALFDVVTDLSKHVVMRDPIIKLSVPYLLILNFISSIPRSTSPYATQFLLVLSHGSCSGKDPDVFFISDLHRL